MSKPITDSQDLSKLCISSPSSPSSQSSSPPSPSTPKLFPPQTVSSSTENKSGGTSLSTQEYESSKDKILTHIQLETWLIFVSDKSELDADFHKGADFHKKYDIDYNGCGSIRFSIAISLLNINNNLNGYIDWTSRPKSDDSCTESDLMSGDDEFFDSVDMFRSKLELLRMKIFVQLLKSEREFAFKCRQNCQDDLDKMFHLASSYENTNIHENINNVVRIPPHQNLIDAVVIGKYYDVVDALVQFPYCRYFAGHHYRGDKTDTPSLIDLTIKNCFRDHPVVQTENINNCSQSDNLIVTNFTSREKQALKILTLLIQLNQDSLPLSLYEVYGSVPVDDDDEDDFAGYITVLQRGFMNVDFISAAFNFTHDLFLFEVLQVIIACLMNTEKFWIVQYDKSLGPLITQSLLKSLKIIFNRQNFLLSRQNKLNNDNDNPRNSDNNTSNKTKKDTNTLVRETLEYDTTGLIWTLCSDILDIHGIDRAFNDCSFRNGVLVPVDRLYIYEAIFGHILKWKNIRSRRFGEKRLSRLRDMDFKNATKIKEIGGKKYYVCLPSSSKSKPLNKMEKLVEDEEEKDEKEKEREMM